MRERLRTEDGVTLAELMSALAILIVLVAIAIPSFMGNANQARDTRAQAELRQVLAPVKAVNVEAPSAADFVQRVQDMAQGSRFDITAVAGVKIERAADGATCLWRISESGIVYGIWESAGVPGGTTLYAELSALPAACPDSTTASSSGFVTEPW